MKKKEKTKNPIQPVSGTKVPRFAGPSTFARLPEIRDVKSCDVAIVGIPFDAGTSYRPGARFGPQSIRQASRHLRTNYHPNYDIEPFKVQQVADAGDIVCNPFNINEAIQQIEELKRQTNENPAMAAANTVKAQSILNQYRLSVKIITDGLTDKGAGLGKISIVVATIGFLFVLPASGVWGMIVGFNEHRRWRWSAIVAGLGVGTAQIGIGWIASLARVSDLNIVSGVGAFLTATGGIFLLLGSRSVLNEFKRQKVYDENSINQKA